MEISNHYLPAHPSLFAKTDHHGWWKCRYCRSKYLPIHPWTFVALPSLALCNIRPTWKWGVRKRQEQFSAGPSLDVRRTTIPGSLQHTTHMEVGSAEKAGAIFRRSIPGRKKAASFEAAIHQASSIFPKYYIKTFICQEQSTGQESPNLACRHGTI
jgi:hypothetical protein